jgi:hypothetical protein
VSKKAKKAAKEVITLVKQVGAVLTPMQREVFYEELLDQIDELAAGDEEEETEDDDGEEDDEEEGDAEPDDERP